MKTLQHLKTVIFLVLMGLCLNLSANDINNILQLETKKCNSGNKEACLALGNVYFDGNGVQKNQTKANEFYIKACDLRQMKACFNPVL